MNFLYTMPTLIQFGCGISSQVGAIAQAGGAKRIFLVYDKGVKAAGLVDGILKNLVDAGLDVEQYDGVLPNPPDWQVQEAADKARVFKADALVALGGGSAMDTAKAVNILLTNPGPIKLYDGVNLVKKPVGPLYAIPTTAGTGSEVTVVTVVTDVERKKKMVIFGQNVAPAMALADPELTLGLPPAITASTGMDALTHALESYVSKLASPVTDSLALESTRVIMRGLRKTYENGKDIAARTDMLLGSMMAGMCFSSTCLGLVHSMAHPMGAYCGVPHGVANSIGLPYVMEYNTPAVPPEKMRCMAEALGIAAQGKSAERLGKEIAELLMRLSKDLNIPRIRDVGVPKELIPTLAEAALEELSTQMTPRTPTKEDVIALFEAAW